MVVTTEKPQKKTWRKEYTHQDAKSTKIQAIRSIEKISIHAIRLLLARGWTWRGQWRCPEHESYACKFVECKNELRRAKRSIK